MKRSVFLSILLAALCLLPIAAQTPRYVDVTIGAGASLSTAANLGACTPVALIVGIQTTPGWTAAAITMQASVNGSTYHVVYDEFAAVRSISVDTVALGSAAVHVRLTPADYWGIYSLKLQSGTPSSAVNQAGARTIRIVCK
jgi:hypothetical protein